MAEEQQQQQKQNDDIPMMENNGSMQQQQQKEQQQEQLQLHTLIAKWGKEVITLPDLNPETTTIGQIKDLIQEQTQVLPKRQKLVGMALRKVPNGPKKLTDDVTLSYIKVKGNKSNNSNEQGQITHNIILMGTKEENVFVDTPSDNDPQVVDDFDLDFNAGSDEWLQHVANGDNLKKFTESTTVHIMNEPREGKGLLVLDLDHTLLDFSSKTLRANAVGRNSNVANAMKRPYMDEFLTSAYRYYDLVVWSQTSWRWLETKLTELGMLANPGYRFCFVLDQTSMFRITSTKRDGTTVSHHVKPLQIIWSKFNQWGSHNTVHIDDLARNFALNLSSGLKVKGFYRKKSSAKTDAELLGLSRYLEQLALANVNFDEIEFAYWLDVVSGKFPLLSLEAKKSSNDDNGESSSG